MLTKQQINKKNILSPVSGILRTAESLIRIAAACFLPLILAVFSFSAVAGEAANVAPSATRSVRVGYYPYAGFQEFDRHGDKCGYGYDYLQKLRGYGNWSYVYSAPQHEWSDMLPMLREGKIDLVCAVYKTPEREKDFLFSDEPVITIPSILTVPAGSVNYRRGDFKHWNGIRVGLLKDAIDNALFGKLAEERKFTFVPVVFDTMSELLSALAEGTRIDAVVTSGMRNVGKEETVLMEFMCSPLYFATGRNNAALMADVNRAMAQLNSLNPEYQEFLRKRYYARTRNGVLSFSIEEQKFIDEINASGRIFSVAMNPDRKPFSWFEDGKFHGIFKDYADEISRRTGLKFRFLPTENRAEYTKARRDSATDIIFDVILMPGLAEKAGLKLSAPYFSVSVSMLRDKLAGISINTISVLESGDLEKKVRSIFPDATRFHVCKDMAEMISDVKNSTSDAAYMFTRSAEYAVIDDSHNQLISTYIPSLECEFAIGVRNSVEPGLLPILDRAVLSLDDSFIHSVQNKYTPKVKEIFSFEAFLHRHPFAAVLVPCAVLLTICGLLTGLLFIRARRKKELQISRDEALKQKELFRMTIVSIGDGVITTDVDGRVQMLNPVAEHLLAVSSKNVIGKPIGEIFRIVSAQDDTPVVSPLSKALATGEIVEMANHTDLLSFDGQRYPIADSAGPIRNSSGKIIGGVLIFRDVTSEYQNREKLRTAVAMWNSVSEVAKLHVFRMNIRTREVFVDIPYTENFWPVKDGKAIPAQDWIHPEDYATISGPYDKFMAGETNSYTINFRAKLNDKIRYFRNYGCRSESDPDMMLGLLQDVTDEKRVELERNASLSLWESVVTAMPILLFVKDADNGFRYIQCNERFGRFVGRKPQDIIGCTDAELFGSPVRAKQFLDRDREIMKGGMAQEFMEDAQGADKHYYFQTVKMPQKNSSGHNILIGLSVDISTLKQAEAERLASVKMWNDVFAAMPMPMYVKDAAHEFRYLQCNAKFSELYGKTANEVLGRTDAELLASPDAAAKFRQADLAVMQSNQPTEFDENLIAADGKLHSFRAMKMPVDSIDGRILVGISADVTEREEGLRLARIAQRLIVGISIERDFDKMMAIIARTAIDVLKCGRVIFARCDEAGKFHFLFDVNDSGLALRFDRNEAKIHEKCWDLYHDSLSRGECFFFTRMGDDSRMEPVFKDYPAYQKQALAGIPQIQNGKLCGLVMYVYHDSHVFSEMEARIFQLISECINIARNRREQDRILLARQNEREHELSERTSINDCMQIFMDSDYMHVPVAAILEEIRKHLGASSCHILSIDQKSRRMECVAETFEKREGRTSDVDDAGSFSLDDAWLSELKRKQLLALNDLAAPDTQALFSGPWRKVISDHGLHAMWLSSIMCRNVTTGCLGIIYDSHSAREFSADDESFVRSVARMVSLILLRMQSRDTILHALDQAKTAEKAKSYFLASMSHEIRTPLNAVIGFTELLKDSSVDYDTRQEYLENIFVSGNLLLQLINDVLDLSKLEADQMPIIPESTNLAAFCDEVCRPFQLVANRKMLNLMVHIPDNVPLLMLDPLRMRQILFNLVGNAIKFTKNGTVKVSANFTQMSTTGGALLLQIEDTGIGIAEADRRKLFEPFVQLSKMRGTNASNSGTGLGLVIVRKLVDKMGGTLNLESEEGVGSTFSILLPSVTVSDGAEKKKSQPEAKTVSGPQDAFFDPECTPTDTSKKLHVLVVDDVPMNTKILTTLLARIKVDSDAVYSGAQAIEKMKTKAYDWVLTDYMMPGMNGNELAKAIRSNPEFARVRIGVVSADQDVLPLDRSLFAAILTKPIGIQQLHEKIFRSNNK